MKQILHLRHKDYPHTEHWYLMENGKIFVRSRCPYNSPSNSKRIMTVTEALRQYTLLTSPQEGWFVVEDTGWHELVEIGQKHPFTEEELIEIFGVAYTVLSDSFLLDLVAGRMDLANPFMRELRKKLISYMEEG